MVASTSPWVWPILAFIVLVFAVWIRLFQTRIGEMKRRRIDPQLVASAKAMAAAVEDNRAADNFRNLFELPVLFLVACLAAMFSDVQPIIALSLGWLFVALRVAHSAIHCTYNKVMHRFYIYVTGGFVLFALWTVLAINWIARF